MPATPLPSQDTELTWELSRNTDALARLGPRKRFLASLVERRVTSSRGRRVTPVGSSSSRGPPLVAFRILLSETPSKRGVTPLVG